MMLQGLIAMIAGWSNRRQQQVIAYLLEENRIHRKLDRPAEQQGEVIQRHAALD